MGTPSSSTPKLLPSLVAFALLTVATTAQDTSDVLWVAFSADPIRPWLVPEDGKSPPIKAVHWRWNDDSVLIASYSIRGVPGTPRVFEIDAQRGVGLREIEGLRGKGVLALSRDSGIVFAYQPQFARVRYPSGEILDTLQDVPPEGFRDCRINSRTNHMLA